MHVLSLSEGLRFNTDVFETNILNLAVVLAIVVIYGGDVFSAVLEARRERIMKSVASAEEKYNAAQEALRKAQQRLTDAQGRADHIRSQGTATVQKVTAFVAQQATEELVRLEDVKASTFTLAEQTATKQVQSQLIELALAKAGTKLSDRLSSTSMKKTCMDFQIQAFDTGA